MKLKSSRVRGPRVPAPLPQRSERPGAEEPGAEEPGGRARRLAERQLEERPTLGDHRRGNKSGPMLSSRVIQEDYTRESSLLADSIFSHNNKN